MSKENISMHNLNKGLHLSVKVQNENSLCLWFYLFLKRLLQLIRIYLQVSRRNIMLINVPGKST